MRGKLKTKTRTRTVLMWGALLLLVSGCSAHKEDKEVSVESSDVTADDLPGVVTVSFPYVEQPGSSSNQYAVWVEDSFGNYVKTVFVTDFTVLGGYESREDSVPEWVDKSGIRDGTGENLDAVSGATPQTGNEEYVWACIDEYGDAVPEGEYKILVEGTVREESRIIYTADITVGSKAMTAQGEPEYYEITGNTDMIGNVTVEYIPN